VDLRIPEQSRAPPFSASHCAVLLDQAFVGCFPGFENAGSLPIRDGLNMDGICIVVIQDENVVISTSGRDWELASFLRVGFDNIGFSHEHGAKLMAGRPNWRGDLVVQWQGRRQLRGSVARRERKNLC
jgi:hypothetical protein